MLSNFEVCDTCASSRGRRWCHISLIGYVPSVNKGLAKKSDFTCRVQIPEPPWSRVALEARTPGLQGPGFRGPSFRKCKPKWGLPVTIYIYSTTNTIVLFYSSAHCHPFLVQSLHVSRLCDMDDFTRNFSPCKLWMTHPQTSPWLRQRTSRVNVQPPSTYMSI